MVGCLLNVCSSWCLETYKVLRIISHPYLFIWIIWVQFLWYHQCGFCLYYAVKSLFCIQCFLFISVSIATYCHLFLQKQQSSFEFLLVWLLHVLSLIYHHVCLFLYTTSGAVIFKGLPAQQSTILKDMTGVIHCISYCQQIPWQEQTQQSVSLFLYISAFPYVVCSSWLR